MDTNLHYCHGQTDPRPASLCACCQTSARTIQQDFQTETIKQTEIKMLQSHSEYTKLRWLLTITGLVLYFVDIGTDIGVAVRYVREKQVLWAVLTLVFVLMGLLSTQIFSYTWYRDDMESVMVTPEDKTTISRMSKGGITGLHLFGMGILTRYYHLLKNVYYVVWHTPEYTAEEKREAHRCLFGLAADLSMLKLFEAYLESVPQLLLQVYVMLDHQEGSLLQYVSMAFSFFNTAWAMVDYRRCLRRSLPQVREMPSGLPTAIYLLYKLSTITAHILAFSLLLMLSAYCAIALAVVWLLGMVWAHKLKTSFCSSRSLEWLYRTIVGFMLVFTFFNVKGQDTKVAMICYYFFYSFINIAGPILLLLLKPEFQKLWFFLPVTSVIYGGTMLGLFCLVVYYTCLHPRGQWRVADEVDGLQKECKSTLRIRTFLHP